MASQKVAALEQRVIELERLVADKGEEIAELRLKNGVDLVSEKRELLTKERAEELLCGASATAEAVRLGTKSFGKDAAEVAAGVLAKLHQVRVADLSDIIAGRPEAEALEVLKAMCGALPTDSLRELDLSENALGEKGIRALEPVLSSLKGLEAIRFANNGLSELSIKLLAEFLPVEHLRELHFHNNMSGSGGARAAASILEKCRELVDFRMSSSRVAADGGLPLIMAVRGLGPSLRKLNLSDSMFDEECTEALVGGLAGLPNLTDLVLRDTGVDRDQLLEALEDTGVVPQLAVLDVSGLELDADAGAQLGRIVGARRRFRKVWMDDNELESEGLANFCRAATNKAAPSMLELVSAQTNQVGQVGALSLARFALAHPTLKRIELNDNQIGADGLAAIKSLLEKAGRLGVLGNLDDNADDCDEDEDIDLEGEEAAEGGEDDDALGGLSAALEKSLAL